MQGGRKGRREDRREGTEGFGTASCAAARNSPVPSRMASVQPQKYVQEADKMTKKSKVTLGI